MNSPKVTVVSLALHRSSGGPTKTIACFKEALNAELYSFFDTKKVEVDPVGVDDANIVRVSNVPVAKQFMWAHRPDLVKAEDALAQSSMVSCHSFYRYHALWVNKMSRKYGVPYWFVPHGILDPWVMDKGRCVKQLFWKSGGQRFLDEASTVIFSTSAECEKAKTQFDLPATEVIPWPVELVDCSDRERRRVKVRGMLGIDDEAKVLLYFGRLHSMKKPLETIRAFAAGGDNNLHLIMVGNEQDVSLKDCYQLAQEAGVHDRVHLVGPVYGNEKYDYLMAADGYISLSHRENFNHTAAESLSAGLPLIISPGNDLKGDIADLKCSIGLCDDEQRTASDGVEAFNSLPIQEIREMGGRGRDWVSKNLQFSQFSNRLRSVVTKYGKK